MFIAKIIILHLGDLKKNEESKKEIIMIIVIVEANYKKRLKKFDKMMQFFEHKLSFFLLRIILIKFIKQLFNDNGILE